MRNFTTPPEKRPEPPTPLPPMISRMDDIGFCEKLVKVVLIILSGFIVVGVLMMIDNLIRGI